MNKKQDTNPVKEEDLSAYFCGYDGCFILYNQNREEYTIYNVSKSEKQLSPCSTFKIINSLIALETNVLEDKETIIPWDGTEYSIKSWNQDQTLETAISNSVVWAFQRLATEVGEMRMQNYLRKIGYGNQDISAGIDTFWLQSSLEISPVQQIEVLKMFYNYQLPFSEENIDVVKEALLFYEEDRIKLSGKTGSGMDKEKKKYINGWFVGYLEKEDKVYYFVTNIEAVEGGKENVNGETAKEIALNILKDKKMY